jgi:aldose 1-epimerase
MFQAFGKLATGEAIEVVHLSNGAMTADVLTYGANLASVKVPSAKSAEPQEVTLNGKGLEDIVSRSADTFFGANPGRVANRIAKGTFQLDQGGEMVTYDKLAINNGENCLHGGAKGFDKCVWSIVGEPTASHVAMQLVSPDGDEGFPGELTARIEYTLNADNELEMTFSASVTGAKTIVNLCNHAYWNMSGDLSSGIHDHTLWLACDHFVETDPATLIPTGAVLPATGDMDFMTNPDGVVVGPRYAIAVLVAVLFRVACFCRCRLAGGGASHTSLTTLLVCLFGSKIFAG